MSTRFIKGQLCYYYRMWLSSRSKKDKELYEALRLTLKLGFGYSEETLNSIVFINAWENIAQLSNEEVKAINSILS